MDEQRSLVNLWNISSSIDCLQCKRKKENSREQSIEAKSVDDL